jgi:hypothetical protein
LIIARAACPLFGVILSGGESAAADSPESKDRCREANVGVLRLRDRTTIAPSAEIRMRKKLRSMH